MASRLAALQRLSGAGGGCGRRAAAVAQLATAQAQGHAQGQGHPQAHPLGQAQGQGQGQAYGQAQGQAQAQAYPASRGLGASGEGAREWGRGVEGPSQWSLGRSGGGVFRAGFASNAGGGGTEAVLEGQDLLKRLVYRSKQRGVLELDLLVGKWVEANIVTISDHRLGALTALLEEESPDLLQWLLGQAAPPPGVAGNEVFKAIRSQVTQRLSEHSNPDTKAVPGADWVKGWGDIGAPPLTQRTPGLPPSGNQ